MRLIDADKLKEWSEIVPLTGDGGIDINDFDEMLKSMPTIDAIPVIRCKDCHFNSNREGNYVNCEIIPQMFGRNPKNYCSMAEREKE